MIRILLFLALVTSPAFAAPSTDADRLFEEGRALADAKNFSAACPKFGQSLALDRAAGTLLNLGDCLEQLGDLRGAWSCFDEAAQIFARTRDPRAAFAQRRADAVASKLATLEGPHHADDTPADDIPVSTPNAPAPISNTPAPMRIVTTRSSPSLDRGRVRLAIGVGVAGFAASAGSLAVGAWANARYDDADCTDTSGRLECSAAGARTIDRAYTRAHVATGLAIGGGVLLGTALVLYLTAPRAAPVIAPVFSGDAAGLSLTGAF